ncbi:hypothetical protein QTG54_005027 [Skeletonema marinoi]|uniref:Uncharacterized protein n=1 Tax=Skeletonema marinoi TaxID=267567 RepID=A0AAD9DFP6_9STRA|nr:hypothetical protein QTG54_005027 [Skeletonema marinoi]
MKFSLSVTTALLLQVSTTAEAASSSSSSATFLDAFEFGRSPPIQRKRNLVIQTDSTRHLAKTAKAEAQSSSTSGGSSGAKASKKGGFRLMPKSTKVATSAFSVETLSMGTLGSIFVEPLRTTKADKLMFADMSYSFADLDFSMPTSFFSMSGDATSTPTSSPSDGNGGGGGGDDGGGSASVSPTPAPTPQEPSNDFHEVVFKYLAVCTGVEIEMDCLTSTTIDALMVQGDATSRARARRFLGTDATMEPSPVYTRASKSSKSPSLSPSVSGVTATPTSVFKGVTPRPTLTFYPTQASVTPPPTVTEVTPPPTQAPVTPPPTQAPVTPSPTQAPVTPSPTQAQVTPSPTQAPVTPSPTVSTATSSPTNTVTVIPTSSPTDQCRPEVDENNLLSILTTSKQECIDSGTPVSEDTFQSTLSSFLAIFDESNTCWDSLCGDSDITSDLFYQILFEEASQCADVTLSVDDCILDHILDMVFQSGASDESGSRVRRSLQESCCESTPTESDLNFYATFLLLGADAACAEQGSVEITTEEWNAATEDLVKLFGATECWGVEPCEEDDVDGQEVPTPAPSDENDAISGDSEDVLPYNDGPVLSDNGQVCTITTEISEDVRSLELSFYYQVETTSDSFDLGLIERALIEKVCDDASNERRLNELEAVVVSVDASPDDVVSEEYTCTSTTPGTNCQVIKGAITILLLGPIASNEESLFLTKIASLFPIALNDTEASITYLATPTNSTNSSATETTNNSTTTTTQASSTITTFGITAAATAILTIALLTRGAVSRRFTQDAPEDTNPEYKGQDELTIAGTAELTCASEDPSPKHHVVNDVEREHWRELGMGDSVDV